MANHFLERVQVPLTLVAVQTLFAGLVILSRVALSNGVTILVYNFYRSVIALVALVPFATCFERRSRPPLNLRILVRMFFLAFTGLVLSNSLYLWGMSLTSASLTAIFENVVPAFTFIVALAMGFEKVHLKGRDGWAKILGTVLCMLGAMIMSIYKGPTLLRVGTPGLIFVAGGDYGLRDLQHTVHASPPPTSAQGMGFIWEVGLNEWQLGTGSLLLGCLTWSIYLTLQVPVLSEFPAPLTITAFTYFFAAIQFLVGACIMNGVDKETWTLRWGPPLFCVLYAVLGFCRPSISVEKTKAGVYNKLMIVAVIQGIIASGVGYALQTYAIKKGGPLLAGASVPLQCVIALALAVIFLGDELYLGSCVGGIIIVLALYLVIWGRARAPKFPQNVHSKDLEDALNKKVIMLTTSPAHGGTSEATSQLGPSRTVENSIKDGSADAL